jgi:CRP-like cAMP-binding protein
VASALRDVLNGMRQSSSVQYVCTATRGNDVFTLTMTAASAQAPVKVLLTREWRADREPLAKTSARPPEKARVGAENLLLAALPANEYERLASGLEPVTITYGQVLYEPGDRMRDVYFPSDCLVSLLTLVEGHRALEVGLVGREGMIGARLALGATQSSVRALVQGTGSAMRMNSERFLREFRRSQTLQRVLLKFTDTLMVQVSQTAACNRFHVVEARLARWLLMTAERMRSDTFHLTHGFLADMLGVRREGVTVAAGVLQRRGIIRYRRGNITIVDRQGLEVACCSCYRHLHLMAAADGETAEGIS